MGNLSSGVYVYSVEEDSSVIRRCVVVTAAIYLFGLAACGGDDDPVSPGPTPEVHKKTVEMIGTQFNPRVVTVNYGDTVVWVHRGQIPLLNIHTTTSGDWSTNTPDGLWDSDSLDVGETFMVVFDSTGTDIPGVVTHVDTTGTIPYYCIPHVIIPMEGVVVVNP